MSVDAVTAALPADVPVAIARQAIHDRWTSVVGYALLLRAPAAGAVSADDEERAATRVIVETFTGIGVGALAGEHPAHVRVPRRFLLELHALALPPERVVLEVAEPGADDTALHAVLERLAERRYRICLVCDPRGPVPLALARHVESVKLDVGGLDDAELTDCVARFARLSDTLIAAGVDTPAMQQRCLAAGFDQLQGFFLSTADEVVAGAAPPTERVGELRSLAGLYAQGTFEELEQTISRDVGLSYRLLTYLNSAYFNLPRRVGSVREALVLLGTQAVRRWATLLVLSDVRDTPHELTITALVRARLCELIAKQQPAGDPPTEPEAFFTVGLFSVVDAIARAPLSQLIDALPLSEEARAALVQLRGPMGDALAATIAYERGDTETVVRRLPGVPVGDLYLSAVGWADATCGVLRETTRTSAETTSGEN
ncbi:MAG TPA: HDOD domain-containing protein [Conexibacter sp.]|nr:HDOD domain-containing protein [Conexibacter sp.]